MGCHDSGGQGREELWFDTDGGSNSKLLPMPWLSGGSNRPGSWEWSLSESIRVDRGPMAKVTPLAL